MKESHLNRQSCLKYQYTCYISKLFEKLALKRKRNPTLKVKLPILAADFLILGKKQTRAVCHTPNVWVKLSANCNYTPLQSLYENNVVCNKLLYFTLEADYKCV